MRQAKEEHLVIREIQKAWPCLIRAKFHVSRLVGCDLLLGNPWMDFPLPIIDTRTGTFFLTEGVPTPTSITCDR